MKKSAAADYEVPGRVQLEQEQFARFERAESPIGWRPKVDLGQMRNRAQMVKPIAIGHCNDKFDAHFGADPLPR